MTVNACRAEKHAAVVPVSCSGSVNVSFYPDHQGHQTEVQPTDTTDIAVECNSVEYEADEAEMVGGTVQQEETVQASRSVELDETEEMLSHFQVCEQHSGDNDVQRYAALAEHHWSVILANLCQNADIAAGVCEKLARIRSWITAVECKNTLSEQKQPVHPTNKKMSPQCRYFVSTKKKPSKRKAEERLLKPDAREKVHLLAALDDSVEAISSTKAGTEHDYDAHPSDVTFEHSY